LSWVGSVLSKAFPSRSATATSKTVGAQPVQALVVLQHVQDGSAQCCGIIGIKLAVAAQAIGERELRAVENLAGHHVVGGIRLANALGEKLLEKKPGQNRHHQKDKSGNGENKFCLQAHGGLAYRTRCGFPV
jgi:hypothetical protein